MSTALTTGDAIFHKLIDDLTALRGDINLTQRALDGGDLTQAYLYLAHADSFLMDVAHRIQAYRRRETPSKGTEPNPMLGGSDGQPAYPDI